MIVGDDDAAGAVGHGVGEDFARVHRAFVRQADGDDAYIDNLMRAVERGAEEVFLLAVGVVADERQHVGGHCDFHALRLDPPAGELDRGEEERRLGVTDARERREVSAADVKAPLVHDPRRLPGERHHVHAGRAFSEQHGEQFLVAQRAGAFGEELFARAVVLRDLADGTAHRLRRLLAGEGCVG